MHNSQQTYTKCTNFRYLFFGTGFIDKFVEVFRLRNKLEKISAEIAEKKWSQQCAFKWGYELYNKTVLYANPMFEKLLLPVNGRTNKTRQNQRLLVYGEIIEGTN